MSKKRVTHFRIEFVHVEAMSYKEFHIYSTMPKKEDVPGFKVLLSKDDIGSFWMSEEEFKATYKEVPK